MIVWTELSRRFLHTAVLWMSMGSLAVRGAQTCPGSTCLYWGIRNDSKVCEREWSGN